MATVSISWARLTTPAGSASISVSFAQLTLPPSAGGGLFLTDRPGAARAGASYEAFSFTATVGLGPSGIAQGGRGGFRFTLGGSSGITDRPGAARAGRAGFAFALLAPGVSPAAVMPTVVLEIDADPDATGLFTVGVSQIGGPDGLAPRHRWVDVPAGDVLSVGVRRGRSREDQSVDVGTMTVVLDGYSGDYDPDNAATPYVQGGGVRPLRTGMAGRVAVVLGGVRHYLFVGYLDATQVDHGWEPTVTWTFTDALAVLGRADVPEIPYSRGGELSSDRAAWLLGLAGVEEWTATPGLRELTPTEGGGSALAALEEAAFAEQGRVFADRTGVVRFRQRWEDGRTPAVVFSDQPSAAEADYSDITVEPGMSQVVNDVTLTRAVKTFTVEDGRSREDTTEAEFSHTDQVSVERHGRRTFGSSATQITVASDVQAQALAQFLATVRADPGSRVSRVVTHPVGLPAPVLAALVDLDLGSAVRVERTTPDGRSLTWDLLVEGIDHTLTPQSWEVGVATAPLLSARHGSLFTVGVSAIGGPDRLAVY